MRMNFSFELAIPTIAFCRTLGLTDDDLNK